MDYDYDEMLKEVLVRRDRIVRKREKRRDQALSLTGCLMAIFIVTAFFMQNEMTTVENPSVAGALMLSSSNGVFVLVAVAAFVLGIVVTLLSVRKKKPNDSRNAE